MAELYCLLYVGTWSAIKFTGDLIPSYSPEHCILPYFEPVLRIHRTSGFSDDT